MTDIQYDEDPEPADRFPAGLLHVPVRPGPRGCVTRLFRTPLGDRTAVGFTSEGALLATLGADQPWIRLSEPALRALTAPLGVTTVTADPQFSAPAPIPGGEAVHSPDRPAARGSRPDTWDPRAVGALRVTGAAALVSALSLWLG
ncbi:MULTISPECIES: SAV_915 family protein [unclassified Streptomyces]|uniref:SAV_915 family protein n=1 Tax=unclassified Streptomyces TaxID=2593676 RepID=UPI003403A252